MLDTPSPDNQDRGATGFSRDQAGRADDADHADQPLQHAWARERDPGSRRGAIIAWLLLIPLLAAVVSFQHAKPAPPPTTTSALAAPSRMEPLALFSRLMVKLGHLGQKDGKPDPSLAGPLLEQIDGIARTTVDHVRAAAVAGELAGPEAALTRLEKADQELKSGEATGGATPPIKTDTIEPPILDDKPDAPAEAADPGSRPSLSGEAPAATPPAPARLSEEDRRALAATIDSLRSIYKTGSADGLSAADRAALVERHGWFADLALVYGKPENDPDRLKMVSGGAGLALLLIAFGLLLATLLIGGVVMFIVAPVMVASGKVRRGFTPPAPGGSVYLETVAAFLAAFLALKGVIFLMDKQFGQPDWMGPVQLMLQWLVLPAIFWPVLRGVPWARWRRDMGWYAPRGVWREIGAGVVGYLAGVPIFLLGVLFSMTAVILRDIASRSTGAPHQSPQNPIIDIVGGGSPMIVLMLYVLAAVWAPIVEEAVFRGALFRHLRGRVPVLVAAFATALAFAFMHGYEVLMLGPVFALGFNFALMREWRGSLIAPMTAHALHNGVTLAFVISMFNLLG